jgi:hypothetical protein
MRLRDRDHTEVDDPARLPSSWTYEWIQSVGASLGRAVGLGISGANNSSK